MEKLRTVAALTVGGSKVMEPVRVATGRLLGGHAGCGGEWRWWSGGEGQEDVQVEEHLSTTACPELEAPMAKSLHGGSAKIASKRQWIQKANTKGKYIGT